MRDAAERGDDLRSVVRTWVDGRPKRAVLVAPAGTDPEGVEVGIGLPATAGVVVGLRESLDGTVLLLRPDDATLDAADYLLNGADRILVILDARGPTSLGWLRRHRAAHALNGRALRPLAGVLAEPALEYGLRYLLSLPVRGFDRDAYRSEPARSKAISAFCAFRDAGVPVEAGPLLLEFLVSNGSTIADATILNDHARDVGRGSEVLDGAEHRFRSDILQVWREATGREFQA
jgi:hypothetical protein